MTGASKKLTADLGGTAGDLREQPDRAPAIVARHPAAAAKSQPFIAIGTKTHAALVAALIQERRLRDKFFSNSLFADPAWDMLLHLYAAYLKQDKTTTTNLCRAAATPHTTALRWIGALETEGLVKRETDHLDRRRVYIILSGLGVGKMESYFSACEAGLTLSTNR